MRPTAPGSSPLGSPRAFEQDRDRAEQMNDAQHRLQEANGRAVGRAASRRARRGLRRRRRRRLADRQARRGSDRAARRFAAGALGDSPRLHRVSADRRGPPASGGRHRRADRPIRRRAGGGPSLRRAGAAAWTCPSRWRPEPPPQLRAQAPRRHPAAPKDHASDNAWLPRAGPPPPQSLPGWSRGGD